MIRPLVAAVLLALPARSVAAQFTVVTDLAAYSAYEWRGLTLTNRPVVQPDLIVTFARGTDAFVVGAWANVELAAYDGPTDISVVGGQDGTAATAWTIWTEASRTAGRVTFAGGINVYAYPTTNGIAAVYNTVEPYLKVAIAAPLNPRMTVFYDVDAVRGGYIEFGASQSLPLGGARTLTLGAVAGISAGQAIEVGGTDTPYFRTDGLSAFDLSVTASVPLGATLVSPNVHVTFGRDDWTKITSPGVSEEFKIWGGFTISYVKAFKK